MKILFIRTTGGMSGAEMYNIYLLKALERARGVSVHLLTNYPLFLKKLRKERIPASFVYSPFPEAGTNRELLVALVWFYISLVIFMLAIKRAEKGIRFDTIVLESMTEKLFLSSFLTWFGYRVIWIEHGPLFVTDRSPLVKQLYVRKSRYADAIIAVSKDTKKDLTTGGVSAEKVHVVYMGMQKIASPSARNDRKYKQWTVGFLGTVTEEKGIAEFMEVATLLSKKYPTLRFLVVGGGPMLAWLKKEIRTAGMGDSVTVTGHTDDVKSYLATMDILFSPTIHNEGLSLSILEALAHGVVVVARDIGGNRELVIDNKTGFLYTGGAKDSYKILDRIISGKTKTADIRNAAYEHIQNTFSMKKQADLFIDIFHG